MASKLTAYGEQPYIRRAREKLSLRLRPVLPSRPRGYEPRVIPRDITDGKYVCSDCKWILRDPLQSFCGHRYCRECLSYLLRSAESTEPVKCQACIQDGSETEFSILKEEQTFPDNGIKREMGGLKAECNNKGCDWKGLFRVYETHEPECDHKSVQCDQCGGSFKPSALADHKKTDCPAQPAQCKHCGKNMTAGELKFHKETCDKQAVICPGCKKSLLREELLDHCDPETRTCPRPTIPCLFGCTELIEPVACKDHLEKNLDDHIASLQLQIQQIQLQLEVAQFTAATPPAPVLVPTQGATASPGNDAQIQQLKTQMQGLENKIKDQETEMRKVISKFEGQSQVMSNASLPVGPSGGATGGVSGDAQRQVDVLDRKMVVFERVSAVFKREIEKVGKQVEDLLKTTQENKDRVEAVVRQFQPIERSVTLQKGQITELQQRFVSSEASAYDGVLVWKIANFAHRRQEATSSRVTSFYSPCFYTSRTGYKACARIYLNGDGMGKGTHVSLFFVLMRGEYDALLHWPFQQKVTMIWMDQNKRDNILDTFRPDPTSSSFKRPTSDMNIASGCPLFMPLTTLESASQGYVKDDVGFIKIIIDRAGLEL